MNVDMEIISKLFNNTALLLSLCLLYDTLFTIRKAPITVYSGIVVGFLAGTIGIAVMTNPWILGDGYIVDSRSILLCMTGLFFGTVPTIVAMAMTSLYRLNLGGGGAAVSGVFIIVASGAIGIYWHHRRRQTLADLSFGELFWFGTVVHAVMMTILALPPKQMPMATLSRVGIPVLIIFPLGTSFLGMLLVNRHRNLHSEKMLRESERRYREVFDNSFDIIFLIEVTEDRKFRFVDINAAEERLLGVHAEEVRGRLLDEIVPAALAAQVSDNYRRCIDAGAPVSYEESVELMHGTSFFYTTLVPLFDESGHIYRIIGISHDITSRKQAEEKVRASENLYHQLFDLESDAIFLIDDKTGNIIEANHTAASLYGFDRDT